MQGGITLGVGMVALLVGYPLMLVGGMWLLDWLEDWIVRPQERAAAVRQLLTEMDEAADLEAAVAKLFREVADPTPARAAGVLTAREPVQAGRTA